ncbi:hypothetical protein J6590_046337 [Homalodisca vitripennis]|nr:hypothetical protein J6590_046337 [Homalodisca vitripennis]
MHTVVRGLYAKQYFIIFRILRSKPLLSTWFRHETYNIIFFQDSTRLDNVVSDCGEVCAGVAALEMTEACETECHYKLPHSTSVS